MMPTIPEMLPVAFGAHPVPHFWMPEPSFLLYLFLAIVAAPSALFALAIAGAALRETFETQMPAAQGLVPRMESARPRATRTGFEHSSALRLRLAA